MSILHVDREHDFRQDKLFTALIISIVVHIFLFIFFSQLAPLYRTPGIIKKTYEVLLLGKAETEKGEELTRVKEDKKKKEEEPLKVKEEPQIEEAPPPPPPKEIAREEPPVPPVAEPVPVPAEVKPEPVKKIITSEPAPVKARPVPAKEKAAGAKAVEKDVAKPEKTVYSSKTDDVSQSEKKSGEGAKTSAKQGAPMPAGQSYMELIKAHVIKNLKYPPAAKINRIEGKVSVSFLVSKDGDSLDVNIKSPSGYPILDDGALRAIKKSEPFPPFEGAEDVLIVHMGGERYASVSFTISFSLDYITMGAD